MMGKGPPSAVVPQYVQIAGDLRSKIKDGTYGPGSLLPSRNEIVAQYGVSAITARDALSMICHEGFAKAIRGRGHIVRRKRSRLTVSGRIYSGVPDPDVPLELAQFDVYQEQPPDNIALPLEADAEELVWVRRAVSIAADDRQPIQIHVSWITGLTANPEGALRDLDPASPWPEAVQQITGRPIASILQNTRARAANPFEAATFGIPDATIVFVAHLTTYDASRRAIEHSRYTWPTDAVRLTDYYAFHQPDQPHR
jgi:DNA-binding GntR family transcriptional regulator